jgi:alpha-glucosidase
MIKFFNLTTGILYVVLFFAFAQTAAAQSYSLSSPDNKIKVEVSVADKIYYQVGANNAQIIARSPISMTLTDNKVLGANAKVSKTSTRSVNEQVKPVYGTNNVLKDQFNELTIQFKDNFNLIFRAYNSGVAYRFVTNFKKDITIKDEEVSFIFPGDYQGYFSLVDDFPAQKGNSYEVNYKREKISQLDSGISYLPLLVEVPGGPKVVITESDLLDYAGLYLKSDGKNGLLGVLPQVATGSKPSGWNSSSYDYSETKFVNYNLQVTGRADYLAKTKGSRTFPWRVMVIANEDKELLDNQLVYLLATPSKIADPSWIKPGKVAWDWWNAVNLTGVHFKTGFNTQTFKYFIDFAAANNIQYVNLDEGWSDQADLLKITTKLDMPEIIRYAKEKNVGLFLWCIWHTLDKQMPQAMEQFQKWGIAGLKVDFMDRDDQEVVNFYERLATEAAKRKILINYHGAMKPTGLERTYPNVINREAVRGLEYNKFNPEGTTPEHAATIAFIRMIAGPMDYTPGAMQNANQRTFKSVNDRPMSQGTRSQQLAMYVVYYAPLQMMADAPTAYEREPEVLKFLSAVPTTWDQTVPLESKVSDYTAIARRKGDTWYVGALTDWTARNIQLDFSFLGEGTYNLDFFADGPNADRVGNDYVKQTRKVTKGDKLTVNMAPGGGWVGVISPAK